MKHNMIATICIVLCMLFVGCTNTAPTTTADHFACYDDMIDAQDHSEYQTLIANMELPAGFVHYEEISHFGSFRYFVTPKSQAWHSYMVTGNSECNVGITIHIGINELAAANNVITDVNLADMRLVGRNDLCMYSISGIHYVYNKGVLIYIAWFGDGVTYSLSNVHMHPVDSSVVGQLLNIEGKTGEDLLALINGDIEEE